MLRIFSILPVCIASCQCQVIGNRRNSSDFNKDLRTSYYRDNANRYCYHVVTIDLLLSHSSTHNVITYF